MRNRPKRIKEVILSNQASRELTPEQVIKALKSHRPQVGSSRCVLPDGKTIIVQTDPEDGLTRVLF